MGILVCAGAMSSCSSGRYLAEGEYLLTRNKIDTDTKQAISDRYEGYVIQRPNKKILGLRFHMFLYNLSNREKEGWPHGWLRRIGEEPVVYSESLTATSTGQLEKFLENKGYYRATVSDTVAYRRHKARVTYSVAPNAPCRVTRINYVFEDTSLVSHILPDTLNSLLRKGMRFDKDVLQAERERLETRMKENGYFRFSREYIYYQAELDAVDNTAELTVRFKEFVDGQPDPRTKVRRHHRYRIGGVYVFPDVPGPGSAGLPDNTGGVADTAMINGISFVYTGKMRLRPPVVTNNNYIKPGQYYNLAFVNRTYRNLSQLGPVRYTNIRFAEIDTGRNNGEDLWLNGFIELSRKKVQAYQFELAGTNSSGDLGVRGNLSYQNLNLFRGAEVFNLRLTGAIEALQNRSNNVYSSMRELGIEARILFPKLFAPIRPGGFIWRYAPKTMFSTSFNYQSRPDYTRSIANGSFSYHWNTSQYISHTFWPAELNYVNIYEGVSSQEFLDSIRNTPLGFSFEDHLVNVLRYGIELNNQHIGKSRDFFYVRFSGESAGNLLNVVTSAFATGDVEGEPGKLLGVPFFQYLRGDIDLRYYNIIDRQNRFVYRFYLGVGYPYGNSRTLPYEKKFFSGGPNSLRAWSTRDVGPGSHADTTGSVSLGYLKKNGDIKIEANIEYRFKVVWKMEAALFVDAGNVWSVRLDEERPNALFAWDRFYREIAVGTGLGARFDFSFFLLRFDFGLKLREPSFPSHERWLPLFRDAGIRKFHFNFGIGYPF